MSITPRPITAASSTADDSAHERASENAPTSASDKTNTGGEPTSGQPLQPRPLSFWVKVLPFFTSAVFFISGLFAVFAPIPLLFLNLRSGRGLALAAVLTNGALVFYAGGVLSLCAYAVFVAVLALSLAEFLRAKKGVEVSAGLTLLSMLLLAGLMVGWFSHIHQVNPWVTVKAHVSSTVDYLSHNVPEGTFTDPAEVDDWKQSVVTEFPSAIAVFALIMVWVSLVAVLRGNPAGVREKLGIDLSYFKKWRSPSWLVWPTIVSGFFLIVDVPHVSDVSLNVFKFLMAIYTIHGLSILSFFFDLWNVRGAFRAIGYLISIFVMMPLLLSLGFFDLWFDFRAKFKTV
jgi:hypothetical protein